MSPIVGPALTDARESSATSAAPAGQSRLATSQDDQRIGSFHALAVSQDHQGIDIQLQHALAELDRQLATP